MADFDWTSLIGPAVGALAGSQSGAQQAGTTTTTRAPWEPMSPYLSGIAGQASNLYGATAGMPNYLSGMYSTYLDNLNNQVNSPLNQALSGNIMRMLGGSASALPGSAQSGVGGASGSGAYAVNGNTYGVDASGRVAGTPYVAGSGGYDASGNYIPAQVDTNAMNAMRTQQQWDALGMGGSPILQNALTQALSGNVDNPYLDKQAQALTTVFNNNLQRNVLPSIRSGAGQAGQYGSSRQGIAEGIGIGDSSTALANALANLYGGAYESAQGRAANTAGQLGQFLTQRYGSEQSRAASENSSAASAGASMQNAQLANQLGQFNSAVNAMNSMNSNQNTNMLAGIGAATQAAQYPWQQLGNYSSIINPMAGMGGSQSTPYYSNPYASALGGAMMGSQVFNPQTGSTNTSSSNPYNSDGSINWGYDYGKG